MKKILVILLISFSCRAPQVSSNEKKGEDSIFSTLHTIHILPKNYIGRVNIYYEHPNGEEEKFDEYGSRYFEFDTTGDLYTKFKYTPDRRFEDRYYFRDSLGELERIYKDSDSILYKHKFEINEPIIVYIMAGKVYLKEIDRKVVRYGYSITRLGIKPESPY
jgi:hypothetical protein